MDGSLGHNLRPIQHGINEVVEQFAQFVGLHLVCDGFGPGTIFLDERFRLAECLSLFEKLPARSRMLCGVSERPSARAWLVCSRIVSSSVRAPGREPSRARACSSVGRPAITSSPAQACSFVGRPIFQVVEDLEGNAQVATEFDHDFFVLLGWSSQSQAGVQSRFEGGRRLEGIDLQGIERGARFVGSVAPEQFGSLPFCQLLVCVGQAVEDIADAVAAQRLAFPAHEAIAQTEQIIADVDGSATP